MTDVDPTVVTEVALPPGDGLTPIPDRRWIRSAVENCSHPARPRSEVAGRPGSQRESHDDLGFGWLYFALARAGGCRELLVVGSGRGFSVACLGLGAAVEADAEVHLVDPGLSQWRVDGSVHDTADGIWTDPQAAAEHFRSVGLRNVRLHRQRSDEAFSGFARDAKLFDVILIDADHGYEPCLADLRGALRCLKPTGFILVHDSVCRDWPGVSAALEAISLEVPNLERLDLTPYPGLSVLQRRRGLITVRAVDAEENGRINAWRRDAGVTERPVPGLGDPGPGPCADPRHGLFGIFQQDELIGGFGTRYRVFDHDGPDSFVPAGSPRLVGHLRYGLVMAPEFRGRGRCREVTCQVLRWFGPEGFYSITRNRVALLETPYRVRVVGSAAGMTAYHTSLCEPALKYRPPAESAVEELFRLRAERTTLKDELTRTHDRVRVLAGRVGELEQVCANVETSLSWRITRPLRAIRSLLRRVLGRPK